MTRAEIESRETEYRGLLLARRFDPALTIEGYRAACDAQIAARRWAAKRRDMLLHDPALMFEIFEIGTAEERGAADRLIRACVRMIEDSARD